MNYGSQTDYQIGTKNSPPTQYFREMVQFDVSTVPAGATVIAATLRLYSTGSSGNGSIDIAAYRITAAWDELTATWNNTGGGGTFDPGQLVVSNVPLATGWMEWALPPALIQEWIDGVNPNYGVLLNYEGTSRGKRVLPAGREHGTAAWHPQLVIEYTAP